MLDNTMGDMRINATAFECCVCISGEKQEHDESVMSTQKEMEKHYHCKTQGDFGFLSKVCANGHMVCLSCHERMWDEKDDTGVPATCPMCRGKLLEPNSLENHDLISVYPAAELLAGNCDTEDPQTIEANCVSWATVVASKVMNSPHCLIYYIHEALQEDRIMPGWVNKSCCKWTLDSMCYQWIPNIHKLLHAKHTLVREKLTTEQYREHLHRTDPTHVFIFYDSIEQYCEQEIIAPLIDMNAQLRCTIRAYADQDTQYCDKLWLQLIKESLGYFSESHNRFGFPDRKNPFKRRYVSFHSAQDDRKDVLTQSDVDLRMHRLTIAIIPLPNLRNTKNVLECISALQKSILEEDPELVNFNSGTRLDFASEAPDPLKQTCVVYFVHCTP